MIIVSQDKDIILNFENIDIILIGNLLDTDKGKFQIIANTISDNEVKLGYYTTEERAKEVLQEIIKQYKELITSYQKGRSDYPIETLIFNRNVYEMPEE